MQKRTLFLVTVATVLYWIVTAVIPVLLLCSYRSVGLDPWDIAKVYSPLYLYPLFFAFLLLPCLVLPLRCVSKFKIVRAHWKALIIGWLVISAGVAAGDWFDHYYTPIWEIRGAVLNNSAVESGFDSIAHFNKPNQGEIPSASDREKYQETLQSLAQAGGNWSASHYWYGITLLIGALTQLAVFIVIGALYVGALKARPERRDEFRSSISWMLLAWIISSIWVFMRLVSEADKLSLYAERNRGADILVVIISLVELIYLAGAASKWFGMIVKSAIPAAFGIGIVIIAVKPDLLKPLIGRGGNVVNFLFLLLALALAGLPWVLTLNTAVPPPETAGKSESPQAEGEAQTGGTNEPATD